MKYLAAILVLFFCSCSKNNPSGTATHNMSANINGAYWFSDSILVLQGRTPNTINGIIGVSYKGLIELNVSSYPVQFSTGLYNFRPAGIDSVNFLHFTAKDTLGNAGLQWSTSYEKSLLSFTIQRSSNALDFSSIRTVNATGDSATVTNYFFTDTSPLPGFNYYRLKATNSNGSFVYSAIVAYNNTAYTIIAASYNTIPGYNGFVNVSSNDTINHIVTGTFSFDCMYQSKLTQIRNGVFNIHYK